MHSLLKRVISMAAPISGGRFLYYLTTFLGMMMLAGLGEQTLAASALISATQTLVGVVLISPLFVCSAIVGRYYASEQYEEAGHVIRQAAVLALLLSILMFVIFSYTEEILIHLGQNPAMAHIAAQFSHTYAFGVLPLTMATVLQQFFMGINQQKFSFYTSVLNLFIFGITAPALIFGAFGRPGFGVAGMALSNVIAFSINLLFLCYYLRTRPEYRRFKIWKNDFSHTHYLKQILSIGFPFTIQVAAELGAYFAAVIIVGWLGEGPLSLTQILTQYSFLLVIPIFGLSQATAILISQVVGRKHFQELQTLVKLCLLLSGSIVLVFAILFIFFPAQLAAPFIDIHAPNNQALFSLLKMLFILKMLDLFFDAIRNILTGALRGLYDTKTPMLLGLLANWVFGVPMGYTLAIPCQLGVTGIYISFTLGNIVSAFVLYRRWQHQRDALLIGHART